MSKFSDLAPTISLTKETNNRLIARILNEIRLCPLFLKIFLRIKYRECDLIYSNTITNGRLYPLLKYLNCPILTHVHELQYTIEMNGKDNLKNILANTSRFIAVSQTVKSNLEKNNGVDPIKINLVHEFVPTSLHFEKQKEKTLKTGRSFVVGASGTVSLRKGTDIFITIATKIIKENSDKNIEFVWIGKIDTDECILLDDVRKLGLEDKIHFYGEQVNPITFYNDFDIFILTSREDPFPLVCLENGSLGKPVICFDKAGGIKEFVEQDAGYVVPYLDIEEMCKKIIYLYNNPDKKISLGSIASHKVLNRFSIDVQAPKVLSVIDMMLQENKQ